MGGLPERTSSSAVAPGTIICAQICDSLVFSRSSSPGWIKRKSRRASARSATVFGPMPPLTVPTLARIPAEKIVEGLDGHDFMGHLHDSTGFVGACKSGVPRSSGNSEPGRKIALPAGDNLSIEPAAFQDKGAGTFFGFPADQRPGLFGADFLIAVQYRKIKAGVSTGRLRDSALRAKIPATSPPFMSMTPGPYARSASSR